MLILIQSYRVAPVEFGFPVVYQASISSQIFVSVWTPGVTLLKCSCDQTIRRANAFCTSAKLCFFDWYTIGTDRVAKQVRLRLGLYKRVQFACVRGRT